MNSGAHELAGTRLRLFVSSPNSLSVRRYDNEFQDSPNPFPRRRLLHFIPKFAVSSKKTAPERDNAQEPFLNALNMKWPRLSSRRS